MTDITFYKNKYPRTDDIVMGIVSKIDNAVYVKLPEYNNIEGMISLKEVSSKRVKCIRTVLQLNKEYPLLVISVDSDKGYIDLSNKCILEQDSDVVNSFVNRYKQYKIGFAIFMKSCFINNMTKEEKELIATKSIWMIEPKALYNTLYDIRNDKKLIDMFDLNQDTKEVFFNNINKYLKPIIYKLKLSFEITTLGPIKEVITLLDFINTTYQIEFYLEGTPLYSCSVKCEDNDKNKYINLFREIIQFIQLNKKDMLIKNTIITQYNTMTNYTENISEESIVPNITEKINFNEEEENEEEENEEIND